MPCLFCYTISFFVPGTLDLIYPLNESRSRKLPILAEYFILDEQKYFYPILVHQLLVIAIGITIVLSTETLSMMYLHHTFGLFDVARYHLKHVFDNETLSVTKNEKYAILHARIVKVINIHRKTIEFADYLLSTFYVTYFIMLVTGIIAITINTFRLIQAVLAMNDFKELIGSVSFIGGQYGFLFFVNFFGQKISDRSFLMSEQVYDVPWYTAPVEIQKLFVFILQKTIKGYELGINGVIVASLENFASLASMTLSYLTMIYSMRKDRYEI
ncbi:uncharacterized protein LOC113003314 [Solenopsis invicta]|uniref:uncharacterized protein LOC113003314 n=1 Tax=Solenopsis invicta TaxID=13686 RepID=UPI00193E0487|nr:uncharacterized protein LOC113003314 [Solenopsis invicta]